MNSIDIANKQSVRTSHSQVKEILPSSNYNPYGESMDIQFEQTTSSDSSINSFGSSNSFNQANSSSNDSVVSPQHASLNNSLYHNSYIYNEDLITPTISPATTPSFNYQLQLQKNRNINYGSDIDFSPLTSPVILPQANQQKYQKFAVINYQDQLAVLDSRIETESPAERLSSRQIREQYQQLEHMKHKISEKLSALQQSQPQQTYQQVQNQQRHMLRPDLCKNSFNSMYILDHTFPAATSDLSSENNHDFSIQSEIHDILNQKYDLKADQAISSRNNLEPVTPASFMNMKHSNEPVSNNDKIGFTMNQQQDSFTTVNSINKDLNNNNKLSSQSIVIPNLTVQNMNPSSPVTQSKGKLNPTISPRKKSSASTSISKQLNKQATKPNSHQGKKQRYDSCSADSKANLVSPRTLKPLLISPTLNPGSHPLPRSLISALNNTHLHSAEDVERILASKSNYQNLMEGKGDALGLSFSTEIKSGLEIRRTAHKAAEQKRRDSLKTWFDLLRDEVENGYVKREKSLMTQIIRAQQLEHNNRKRNNEQGSSTTDEEMEELLIEAGSMRPLSKVLLLQYAYEYIYSLKASLEEKDNIISNLRQEVKVGSKRKSISDEDNMNLNETE